VRFNPCFIGKSSATSSPKVTTQGRISVSILVLLESLLQQTTSIQEIGLYRGFNPCFIGKSSATSAQSDLHRTPLDLSFNPCFIGKSSATFLNI